MRFSAACSPRPPPPGRHRSARLEAPLDEGQPGHGPEELRDLREHSAGVREEGGEHHQERADGVGGLLGRGEEGDGEADGGGGDGLEGEAREEPPPAAADTGGGGGAWGWARASARMRRGGGAAGKVKVLPPRASSAGRRAGIRWPRRGSGKRRRSGRGGAEEGVGARWEARLGRRACAGGVVAGGRGGVDVGGGAREYPRGLCSGSTAAPGSPRTWGG